MLPFGPDDIGKARLARPHLLKLSPEECGNRAEKLLERLAPVRFPRRKVLQCLQETKADQIFGVLIAFSN
jgi:hypothetical protein